VNPEDVHPVDVNMDGHVDVIECHYDHSINIFINKGDGTFQPAVGYVTGEYPRAVAVADMNGDGVVDLVVSNVGFKQPPSPFQPIPGSVGVLLGNGGGTFQAPILYTPFTYPGWLAIADFDHDGRPDMAVERVDDGHSVNVMKNTTGL
jgi:hypothetical protein